MTLNITASSHAIFTQSVEKLELIASELSEGTTQLNETLHSILTTIKATAREQGLMKIVDLSHDIEVVLADMGINQRVLTSDINALLLSAVNLLKDSLSNIEPDDVVTRQIVDNEQQQPEQNVSTLPEGLLTWDIIFKPPLLFLRAGGEPIEIFQALAILGELTVEVIEDNLPLFSELEPDHCYLSWHLTLRSYAPRQEIEACLSRYEAECELELTEHHALPAEYSGVAERKQSTVSSVVGAVIPPKADKLDVLQALLKELMLTQVTLSQLGEHFDPKLWPKFDAGLEQLAQHTSAIEDVIRQMRRWPISHAYRAVQSTVDELSESVGKKVEVMMSGEQLEIDKALLESITDPLVELVSNVIQHGIELPALRQKKGKSEVGQLRLNSYRQAAYVIIEVSDDGMGLDKEQLIKKATQQGRVVSDTAQVEQLVFTPGFSTAAVKDVICSLGGQINVTSKPNQGTTFTLRFPEKDRVIEGQIIKVADESYSLPLGAIIESLEIEKRQIKYIHGKGEIYLFEDDYIPVIQLGELLELPAAEQNEQSMLAVVDIEGKKVGLLFDELLSQQRVVIKSLETHYRKVEGFLGATVMGEGTVVLALNLVELFQLYKTSNQIQQPQSNEGRFND